MRKLTTVFAILVMAIAALADAGVGQMPSGGSAGIMGDDLGIRLVEEIVVVELEKNGYDVSFSVLADFALRNSSSEKSVFLFLPITSTGWHRPELAELVDGGTAGAELRGYDVWLELDGAKLDHQLFIVKSIYDADDLVAPEGRIAFQTNDGKNYALWSISRAADGDIDTTGHDFLQIWAVCSADIPAGDSTLRYHYGGTPSLGVSYSFSDVYYPLWSGASWSGTIGTGTVTYVYGDGFSIDDTFGDYSAPEGVEVETLNNGYRFSFENYEPQPGDEVSIEVVMNNRFSYDSEGLRVAPSFDAAFASGVVSFGNQYLFILDAQGAWIKGRTEYKGEEITGWLFDESFHFHDGGCEGDIRLIWENPINFRTEPNSSAERVADYPTVNPYGYDGEWDVLQFIERKGDWLRIIVVDHDDTTVYHHGWVRWRYLDPETGEEYIYITK